MTPAAPPHPVPMRALAIATLVTCALGWLFKAHCQVDGAWTGSEQYLTGCYSDVVPFWSGRGVAAGEIPYFQARLEYPVLTGLAIWIEGGLTRLLFGAQANALHFLSVATAVNTLLALAVLRLLAALRLPEHRLWMWACAPPLLLYVGHNWDLVAILPAVLAMLFAARGRNAAAGGAIGLGAAAKLFPAVMLPPLMLPALGRRRLGAVLLGGIAAVAAWALVNAPVVLGAFANWGEFYTFSQARTGTAASAWELLSTVGGIATSVPTRNFYAGVIFVAGAAAIMSVGWWRLRDQAWTLATPVLAWFMLTNKVYSPQFDLWLLPLLLITVRRPWLIAAFVAGDLLAYWAEFWMFAGMEGARAPTGSGPILIAALIRGAAMLAIIVEAIAAAPPHWLQRVPVAREGGDPA